MAAYPATDRIARFAAETTLDAVPPTAVDTATTAFMDCLGVALAGSRDGAGTLAARVRSFLKDVQALDTRRAKALLQTILSAAHVYRDGRIELEFREQHT